MQSIGFVLIFIAHATISEATKELTNASVQDNLLTQVFKQNIPSLALKQIAETMLVLLDKIFKYPSEWLKLLTPLIHWLTLHKDDGLVESLFSLSKQLPEELTRLHDLL